LTTFEQFNYLLEGQSVKQASKHLNSYLLVARTGPDI
jgi:hypothetical protein